MKDTMVVFAEEFKKDCDSIKEKLSWDQDRLDPILAMTMESEKISIPFMTKIITSIVTIFIALLIGISFMLFLLSINLINSPESPFIFSFSLFIYIFPAIIFHFAKKEVIATILSVFGLILMTVVQVLEILFDRDLFPPLYIFFFILIITFFLLFRSKGLKVILFILFFTVFSILIVKELSSALEDSLPLYFLCYICMGINALLFFTAFFLEKVLDPLVNRYYTIPLKLNGLFFFFFYFFFLTFIDRRSSTVPYLIHNIFYFIITTGTLLLFFKYNMHIMKQIALIYFCAYVFFKYYDLVWLLLHKSLVLIILGVVFVVTATIAALRWGVLKKNVQ